MNGCRRRPFRGAYCRNFGTSRLAAQEGLAMRLAAKGFTAILSIITVGAALSLTIPLAFAGDDGNSKNVTEDEIVRALAPAPKKPLTRGLSIVAPQADPAPSAAETKLIQSV